MHHLRKVMGKICCYLTLTLVLMGLTPAAQAQIYPNRTVQIVCSRWEGSNTDRNLRLLLKYLAPRLNARFAIVNCKSGDDSELADYISAPNDGYTLIAAETFGLAGNEVMGAVNFGYSAFTPVAVYAQSRGWILAVAASAPWQSLDELIEAAAARPGSLRFGCTLNATSYLPALMMERDRGAVFEMTETIDHPTARLDALTHGQVDVAYLPYSMAREALEQKSIRALVTMTADRLPRLPQVPTASESGLPNLITEATYVLLAPQGTSMEIVEKLNAAICDVVRNDPGYARELGRELAQSPFVLDVPRTKMALELQRSQVQSYTSYWRAD